MPLIQAYKVISKTTTGHVDEVEIGVPDWVYNGIVKEKGHPHILTIHPDYEGLSSLDPVSPIQCQSEKVRSILRVRTAAL